jgi:multicomponent Na+:H+ antiporter subunit B
MLKRLLTIALMVALAASFFPLMSSIRDRADVGPLAAEYLEDGASDLGAANLVTAVVVTYRGLDTLGEVTVLFAAAAGIALVFQFIRRNREGDAVGQPMEGCGWEELPCRIEASEILKTASGILLPLFLMFGVYIFTHGHLTPGGGFQGGVVIASAILLAFLAGSIRELRHSMVEILEMLAGAGYVAIGLLGIWLAAGFLDPRFLPAGEFGALFSAGAIPVIYSLVGIKVGSELSGVIDVMRRKA